METSRHSFRFFHSGIVISCLLPILFISSCQKAEIPSESSFSAPSSFKTKSDLYCGNTDKSNFAVSESDLFAYIHYLDVRKDCSNGKVIQVQPVVHNTDTVYFIINFESGWQLLSADKRGPIVLAQNPEGTFSLETINPGQANWLESITDNIEYRWNCPDEYYENAEDDISELEKCCLDTWLAITADTDYIIGQQPKTKMYDGPIIFIPRGHYELDEVYQTHETFHYVPHLLNTHWHQSSPFNSYIPFQSGSTTAHCPAGCVAIAAAQVLYYLHYQIGAPLSSPTNGYCYGDEYNYSMGFSDYSSATWDYMSSYSDPAGYASLLIGSLALLLDMDFSSTGSGAAMNMIKNPAYTFYGVDCSYLNSYNSNTVYQNLLSGLPVIFGGNYYEYLFSWPGHAFIIDGYEDYVITTHYVYRWVLDEPLPPGGNVIIPVLPAAYEETVTSTTPILSCFYLNWGNGENDMTQYATDGIWSYGNAPSYQYNREMIYNFSALNN